MLAAMSLSRLNLEIIPLRSLYHIWPGNAFIMFDDRMVMVETYSAELTIIQPRELALYAKAFALLHRSSMYGNPDRDLIAKALADLS